MKIVGIIPARYASTRFPGKPLALLQGKYIIQHVYENVCATLHDTYVATDDERIYKAVEEFGGKAIMTSPNHQSGTDRVREALDLINKKYDVVVNIQGDEPFIQKSQIETLCTSFEDDNTQIATLGKRFSSMQEVENENSPKVVVSQSGFAIYFSRSVVPFIRGKERKQWLECYPFLKHIGIYAYRTHILQEISKLPQSPLELAESLEQLRWLEAGYKIKVGLTDVETIGIDTSDDLKKAQRFIISKQL